MQIKSFMILIERTIFMNAKMFSGNMLLKIIIVGKKYQI